MENIKRLRPYVQPHLGAMALTALCMVTSGLLTGAVIYMIREVLVPILSPTLENRAAKLNLFVVVLIGVVMLRATSNFGQAYLSQRTGQKVLASVRADLFAHLQKLSVGFFERSRTGEIMSRLTNDLNALQSVLTQAVSASINAPVGIIVSLGSMLYFNWRLSVFVAVILPPLAFTINRANRKIRGASKNLQMQLGELTNYLQEKIAAIRLIQTFGTNSYEVEEFNRVNRETYRRTMKPIRISTGLAPIVETVGFMGLITCLWVGAQTTKTPEDAAALITFLIAMNQLAGNVKSLGNLSLIVRTADSAASRLWEISDTLPEVRDRPDAVDLRARPTQGHLCFESVRFAYGDGPEVLHGVSFEVKPGQAVALAGRSGSGKSTIAALVPRLYDPTGGSVRVDGLDLRDVKLDSLRAHIGAVPQDVTLFHGTVRDNIAYGTPDATLEQITEAARRAFADEFIRALPEGYDTQIGERGLRLSGGQRQRIAIARALLRDPKILILDEATSALDAESEREVQAALEALMAGRTTLIIAHRFSTIQRADKILVLDAGNIIEQGTHDELLSARGTYWELFRMQAFEARFQQNLEADGSVSPDVPALEAAPSKTDKAEFHVA